MTEEARKAQREYYKAWREKNKEHLKEYRALYWKRRAEKTGKTEKTKKRGEEA